MYFVSQQDIYVNTYKYSIILIIVKHKISKFICRWTCIFSNTTQCPAVNCGPYDRAWNCVIHVLLIITKSTIYSICFNSRISNLKISMLIGIQTLVHIYMYHQMLVFKYEAISESLNIHVYKGIKYMWM